MYRKGIATTKKLAGIALLAVAPLVSADNHADLMARLSVAQAPLAQTQAPQVGNLTLSGQFDKTVYRQGDWARLTVQLKQPVNQISYVALVQAYPDGRVVKLFPNAYQQNNAVLGNNRFEIRGQRPEGLYVNDQAGTYLVKLIASTDPQRLNTLLSSTSSATQLAANLSSPQYLGVAQGTTVWASNDIAYGVAGANGLVPQPVAAAPVVPVAAVPVTAPQVVAAQPQQPAVAPAPVAVNFQQSLQMFSQKKSDFNVSIMTRNNQQTYRSGEALSFVLSSERDCDAGLIELAPNGQLNVLYPNSVTPKLPLSGNAMNWLPQAGATMKPVTGGPGEYAYLMVCSDKENFFEWLTGQGPKQKGFTLKPTVTVEELLKDREDSWEAYAYTRIRVQ